MIVFVFLLDFLFSAFHFCASALCQCHWASGCVCEVQTPDSQVHRDREIINLITNWDCIFLVIHFVLFMLRIVTNHLVIFGKCCLPASFTRTTCLAISEVCLDSLHYSQVIISDSSA